MKNIKDIVIGIFAVIGFTAIVTGFTNEAGQEPTFGTPESHVWEVFTPEGSTAWLLNKQTGEIIGLDANNKKKYKIEWK